MRIYGQLEKSIVNYRSRTENYTTSFNLNSKSMQNQPILSNLSNCDPISISQENYTTYGNGGMVWMGIHHTDSYCGVICSSSLSLYPISISLKAIDSINREVLSDKEQLSKYVFCYMSLIVWDRLKNLKIKDRIKLKILHFCSVLYIRTLNRNSYTKDKGYVPCHSQLLRNIYGTRHFPIIVSIMEENNWIIRDNSYKTREKSKKYKLCLELNSFQPFYILHRSSKNLVSKLNSFWKESQKWQEQYLHQNVTIGENQYNAIKEYIINISHRLTLSDKTQNILQEIDPKHHLKLNLNLFNFLNKDFNAFTDKAGRWYHFATLCKRELRRALLIDGEETVELDVRSSQPLLMINLYKEDCEEKQKYINLFKNGDFYFALAAALGFRDIANKLHDNETRKKFKQRVLCEIFYDREKSRYKLWAAFLAAFPILGQLVREIKKQKDEHFAVKMQRAEADLIVTQVIDHLRLRDIPALPIHDSILCRKADKNLISELIEKAYIDFIGIAPQIELKPSI